MPNIYKVILDKYGKKAEPWTLRGNAPKRIKSLVRGLRAYKQSKENQLTLFGGL